MDCEATLQIFPAGPGQTLGPDFFSAYHPLLHFADGRAVLSSGPDKPCILIISKQQSNRNSLPSAILALRHGQLDYLHRCSIFRTTIDCFSHLHLSFVSLTLTLRRNETGFPPAILGSLRLNEILNARYACEESDSLFSPSASPLGSATNFRSARRESPSSACQSGWGGGQRSG